MTLDLGSIRFDMDATPVTQGSAAAGRALDDLGKAATRAKRPVDDLLAEISQSKKRADDFIAGQRGMATSTTATGVAAGTANRHLGTLAGTLARNTASAAGLSGPMGQVAATLTRLGGPIALGAVAALTAIAAANRAMGRDAREAREETEKLIDKLVEAANLRSGQTDRDQETALRRELRLAELSVSSQEGAFRTPTLASRQRLNEAKVALQEFLTQRAAALQRSNEEEIAGIKRTAEERLASQRAYVAEQQRIQAAELKALEEGVRRRNAIMRQFTGPDLITGAGGSQIRTTPQQAARGRLLLAEADEARRHTDQLNASLRDTASVMKAIAPQQARYNTLMDQTIDAHLRAVDAQTRTRYAILDAVAAFNILPDSISRITEQAIALSHASQQPGFTGKDGILGGITLAAGVLGGIFSQLADEAEHNRRVRAELERGRKEYAGELTRFNALFTDVGPLRRALDEMEGMADGLHERFVALHAAVRPAVVSGLTPENAPDRLAAVEAAMGGASRARREQLEQEALVIREWLATHERSLEARARQAAMFSQELEERALAAEGRTAELDIMRQQNRHRLEALDAERAGLDAVTRAALARVQSLEAEELARAQAIDALRTAADRQGMLSDLDAREARVRGDLPGASRIEAEAIRNRNRADAEAMLVAGNITAELFHRITRLLDDELNATLAETARAAGEAANALLEQARAQEQAARLAGEDLDVRLLRAMGQTADADALQRQLQRDREVESFRERGFGQELIDKLLEAFRLEELAVGRGAEGPQGRDGRGVIGNAQVRDVTGITEASAVTMTAHLFSLVFVNREQLNELRKIHQRLGNLSGQTVVQQRVSTSPPLTDILRAVDRGAGDTLAITNGARGVRVTA